tara:strand:+ start:462 stop:596 length:135 start_codon:yes stop_codon:yes gene_type:complete
MILWPILGGDRVLAPPFDGDLPVGACVERTAVLISQPANDGGTR